jgi:hypothetical protein
LFACFSVPQGRLDEAEKYFGRALEEAKKGFGDRDPHVASSCNNLVWNLDMSEQFCLLWMGSYTALFWKKDCA